MTPKYVIITPAHNEEAFIEKTIGSMVVQTVLPIKWVVVNDGSTDRTGQIVESWANRHGFIQLVNLRRDEGRNFARKALAFEAGFREIRNLPFDFIGNVDADMTFAPEYFQNILKEFESSPKLGISGGIVYTRFTDKFVTYDTTADSVGGKVQLFRKECFEAIGGYMPLEHGGIDTAAEIMARMKGWTVRKSLENKTFEHRPTSFAWGTPLKAKMREGSHFHSLGYDPLFYALRCIYRIKEYPFVLGSVAAFLGYFGRMVRRRPIALPAEVVRFLRAEQRGKLARVLRFSSGSQNLRSVPSIKANTEY
jgi:glycosyltransferase involved in cell wall biosynthesis